MQRFVLAMGIAFALSGCLSQPMIEAMPTVDANAGCLGAKIKDCLGVFSGRVSVADYNRAITHINGGIPNDVNGRPVSTSQSVAFTILGATIHDMHGIDIDYKPDGTVVKLSIILRKSPLLAHTMEDYSATGIYDAMLDAFGKTCNITKDPLLTYKFFENVVKPAFVHSRPMTLPDDRIAAETHTEVVLTSRIPVCGHNVALSSVSGENWSERSEFNRYGSYTGSMLDFD